MYILAYSTCASAYIHVYKCACVCVCVYKYSRVYIQFVLPKSVLCKQYIRKYVLRNVNTYVLRNVNTYVLHVNQDIVIASHHCSLQSRVVEGQKSSQVTFPV